MKETIEFETFDAVGGGKVITARVSDMMLNQGYGPAILKEFSLKVVDKLVDIWMEKHGAEALEQLAPGAVADTVRAQVAKKVFG